MQIQKCPQGGAPRRLQLNAPQDPPPPPGEHHQHGVSGTLPHAGHDLAMVAMTLPTHHSHQDMDMGPICHGGGAAPADPHAGHTMPMDHSHMDHSHMDHSQMGHQHSTGGGSSLSWLGTGSAVLSGVVAVGSAVHAAQMLSSKDRLTQLEGANHLLMSASCGVMAGAMLAPSTGLGAFTSPLMTAHGLGEVALGAYQLVRGTAGECQHDQVAGVLKLAHGGCLAAAQFFPGAALPLYLGMAAVTASQVALQQAGLSH
ncbi:hypothetical protein JST97_02480 [bacterium]|nr:hypothetical protein [bacterium]